MCVCVGREGGGKWLHKKGSVYSMLPVPLLLNASLSVSNTIKWRCECCRCAEALRVFDPNSTKRCVVLDMIEFLPETFKVNSNSHDFNVINMMS